MTHSLYACSESEKIYSPHQSTREFRVLKIVLIRNSIEVTVGSLRTPQVKSAVFFLKIIDFLVWVTDYYKIYNKDIFVFSYFCFQTNFAHSLRVSYWFFDKAKTLLEMDGKLPQSHFLKLQLKMTKDLRSTLWVHFLNHIFYDLKKFTTKSS